MTLKKVSRSHSIHNYDDDSSQQSIFHASTLPKIAEKLHQKWPRVWLETFQSLVNFESKHYTKSFSHLLFELNLSSVLLDAPLHQPSKMYMEMKLGLEGIFPTPSGSTVRLRWVRINWTNTRTSTAERSQHWEKGMTTSHTPGYEIGDTSAPLSRNNRARSGPLLSRWNCFYWQKASWTLARKMQSRQRGRYVLDVDSTGNKTGSSG